MGTAYWEQRVQQIAKTLRRRKGSISLTYIDHTINADTSQPIILGRECANCGSKVKYAKRPGTCVRCHKQWRRDHERRPKYYYSKSSNNVAKIDPETRLEMAENQGWSCLICNQVVERLYLDHCHETGKIRGLLCLQCNSGLGSFRDDPDRLASAIRYLQA